MDAIPSGNYSREFLDVPSDENDLTKLLGELSSKNMELVLSNNEAQPQVKSIKPTPGFCIKTRDENNSKVFINICHCLDLPKPGDLSEEKLIEILASDDPSEYRVPMSLGEPHEEVDKSGNKCVCYDVIINSEYYDFIQKNEIFRKFLITVSYEGVQDKYHININGEDGIVLKNKNYHGTMPDHHIRCKPLIVDLGSSSHKETADPKPSAPKKKAKRSTKSSTICPRHVLRRIPASGFPEKLILEVCLPNLLNGESVTLCVGEDRIQLSERIHGYELDIFSPYNIVQTACFATFNVSDKILSLMMFVAPEKENINNEVFP